MAVTTRGRYFGDISWFSQRSTKPSYGSVTKALKAHIKYIANPNRKDLVYAENLNMDYWLDIAQKEINKRWDSRIAGKVIVALPNEMGVEEGVRLIKEFFMKEVGTSDLGIAVHDSVGVVSGERNLHAHIVFSARDKEGKKLRLNPTKLREIQRKWDEYLNRSGYSPDRCPVKMKKKIRPYHVRPDSALYDLRAVEYLRTRRRVWTLSVEAFQLERKYQEERVSRRTAVCRVRTPVDYEKPSQAVRQFHTSHTGGEAAPRLEGKRNFYRVEMDAPFQELGFSVWDDPISKLKEKIQGLNSEIYRLELEKEDSRWNPFKKMRLSKQIKEIQEEVEALKEELARKQKFDEMTRRWIREFTDLLYKNRKDISIWNHSVAILAVHPRGPRKQFLVKIKDLEDRISYLRKLNADGYNIYVSVNVLHPGAESRKADDFLPFQVAVYLDLDSKKKPAHELWKEIWRLIQERKLPEPSYVVKSSKGNYQAYWICQEPVEHSKLRAIMEGLCQHLGIDHTQDIARVFRLPGFRNKKPGKDDLVQPPKGDVIWIDKEKGAKVRSTKRQYSRDIFEKLYKIWGPGSGSREISSERKAQTESQKRKEITFRPSEDQELEKLYRQVYMNRKPRWSLSEVDMAFVNRALRNKFPPERIASFLAHLRSDKVNPVDYARRTVQEGIEFLRTGLTKRQRKNRSESSSNRRSPTNRF